MDVTKPYEFIGFWGFLAQPSPWRPGGGFLFGHRGADLSVPGLPGATLVYPPRALWEGAVQHAGPTGIVLP